MVALFSRMSGPAVLDQRTRGLVYEHIRVTPGSHYRQIQRQLGLAQGTLTHHLYTLERERLIRRQRQGLRVRFFPGTERTVPANALHPWQHKVLHLVRKQPGLTQSEAARILGLTRQALHYHVELVRRRGLLLVTHDGRESRLQAAPGLDARLGTCPNCGTVFEKPAGAWTAVSCPECGTSIRATPVRAAPPVLRR